MVKKYRWIIDTETDVDICKTKKEALKEITRLLALKRNEVYTLIREINREDYKIIAEYKGDKK